jgi:hypothetical protein
MCCVPLFALDCPALKELRSPLKSTFSSNSSTDGWIDTECDSSTSKLNFDNNMCAYTLLQTMHRNTEWEGCLEARPGSYAVDLTAPSAGNTHMLFVPYFQPDEPDVGDYGVDKDYTYDYLEGGSAHDPTYSGGGRHGRGSMTGGIDENTRLEDSLKYEGQNKNNDVNGTACIRLEPIQELTNDTQTVKLAINDMQANRFTHIPLVRFGGCGRFRRARLSSRVRTSTTKPYKKR